MNIAKDDITLRDYFALTVLPQLLSNYNHMDVFEEIEDVEGGMPFLLAKDAYIMADAMVKARKA